MTNMASKISDEQRKKLIEKAIEARSMAYVPYSHFAIGAALLTEDGTIYQGGNIENAAYGVCNCAERTAIFKAVSEGKRKLVAIAVAGGPEGADQTIYPWPCGACRQVMREFADGDFAVICAKSTSDYEEHSLDELLPYAFDGSFND